MSNQAKMNIHANPARIIGIQFSMLSPEEILRNSVAEITKRETYNNNKPVIGGLFDPRMGVLEPGLICPTDGLTYINTPGYFGHINLARPVFFIQHIKDIMKICRSVCFKCSKLKINKNLHSHALDMNSMDRWDYVSKLAADVKRCGDTTDDGCGCLQPDKIKLEGMATIIAVWSNIRQAKDQPAEKITMKMTPEIVLKIFKRISDEDVHFMGFNPTWSRPDWMICQVLPVAPPAVRPSVKHDAQQRSEDDLTHIYSNIIKTNSELMNKINDNAQPNVIDGLTTVLQYFVAMIVNNKVKGAMPMAQRSGRPLQCIMGRINSKNGRIRGNLMGKRVDFSARSVITGDPNLSIRQLGVPMKIAKNITKPIVVNDRNRDFLMKLIQNGPDKYPGAKILERKNGEQISLRYVDRDSIRLDNGDIVHRHMMNGDAVLFNRQPSLHRMSMMCHIVQVMRVGDTFRMNVGDTKPYNADFDGDEMNMHMPQNVIAETELRHLAAIPYQIISPANNSPIIGIYQDSMLGSYRFTREKMNFTPRQAMNLLMMYPNVDVEALQKPNHGPVTNFDILSQIMPPLTMAYKTDGYGDGEDYATSNNVLEIRAGKYIRGQMDKAVLGKSTKGIIHRAFNDFGNRASSDFIDNLQNIITEYMKTSSFSVGISDLIADPKTNSQIIQVINKQKGEVNTIIEQLHQGIFENNTSATNQSEFEKRVNNVLNDAMNETGKISRKSLNKENRFLTIVASGSKGSLLNISQMISCLGQQNVDGKRIPYGFDGRTLPHYSKFDDSPNARGFIENSYISGLTAPELFFHAMGGRIGLIDTAVKSVTWETPIVVIVNQVPIYTEIGKWIDGQLDDESVKPNVMHFTERNMELLNLTNGDVFIPTTCENGKVTWEEVTAITRHDPGEVLYEIKSLGGRSVIVTESKSLLIWDDANNGFFEKPTPEIKVGDCVPVTSSLREPPVVLSEIRLSEYLPKSEYVYGTDFHLAVEQMELAMESRKKIPAGWWDENNGKAFQLPYSKKSSLHRTVSRSNLDAIRKGGVYPYHANRSAAFISDVFELTEENGVFVGLFLADGNVHNDHIYISKNSVAIQSFVKGWYEKRGIQYRMTERTNHAGGISTSIVGNSAVFARFLSKLVGKGAASKHIPTEAYISTLEFAKGILTGYFSGDGTVSKNSVEACSASRRLIEGINMLCSRIGVFGKVSTTQLKRNNFGTRNILPSHRLSIRAQWGKVFTENITLLEEKKQERLSAIQWRNYHSNFKTHNDVVLDPIVEINLVSVEKHPKVYDLTIPTTLNFGLANGLQVRDTSQTGYIQRRLIKGLEDLKVEYDMTVRNSKGKIIQFKYGDDGFDTTRVENQVIPLVAMSVEDIYMHYDMMGVNDVTDGLLGELYTKGTVTRLRKQRVEAVNRTKKYIQMMLDGRDIMVEQVFRFRDDNSVRIPVAFQSIIQNVQGTAGLSANSVVDITPLEAYELIEEYYKRIVNLRYVPPTPLFRVMYFYYLSPRDLLMVKRFHRNALVVLLETVVLKYKQAIVHPGEMVGVIAGQSIGEPTTQLTLNTFHNAGTASKSNVTRGVPRIEEILRLTKNPKNPSLTVFLKSQDESNQERANVLANMMEHTKLYDVVSSIDICFDPLDTTTYIPDDRVLMEQFAEFEALVEECDEGVGMTKATPKSKWVIRMELDPEILLDKNITMDDVHFAIKTSSYGQDINCVYSDFNSDKLVFRIRMNSSVFQKGKKRTGVADTLDQSDEIYLLRNFQDNLLHNIVLRGISSISNALPRKIQNMVTKDDGKYVRKDTWVVDTTGTNLIDALGADYIDSTRTYSNDIKEVFDVLGIEAARQVIHNELVEVMEFSGVYINYHHTSLLCDRMTSNQNMVSIFRTGIIEDNIGPIAKATFEVHTEVLLDAARHADFDHMRGVSANVMCGQNGYYGTSAFQLVLDMKEMEHLEDQIADTQNAAEHIDEMFSRITLESEVCPRNKIEMENNIDAIRRDTVAQCDDDYNMGF